jgi:hypothetical protein
MFDVESSTHCEATYEIFWISAQLAPGPEIPGLLLKVPTGDLGVPDVSTRRRS